MKFKSLFYDSSINLKSISKVKILFGVILGVTSSLIIYSFFYLLIEAFRYIDAGFSGELVVLSEENRNYYSLFFSTLSVVFGNSIAFNFVFSKPQKITHRYNSKRKRLLNDNTFLGFNFSYWFAKIGVSFGVFGMCCFGSQFLPYFKEFSFLLIIVLYLEALKSFSFFLRNSQRLKFIVQHVILLSIVSFGISKIELIDYRKLDKVMVENNPLIELPKASYVKGEQGNNYTNYFYKMDMDSLGDAYVYYQNRKIDIEDVMYTFDNHIREELLPFRIVYLDANKNCSINDIKRFEKTIFQQNVRRIFYTAIPDSFEEFQFERTGIMKNVSVDVLKLKDRKKMPPYPANSFEGLVDERVKDTVVVSIDATIMFNNKYVEKGNLKKQFKEHYSPTTLFLYQYNSSTIYQDYINVLSAHIEVVDKIRESQQKFFNESSIHNTDDFVEEQKELRMKFPLNIGESFN